MKKLMSVVLALCMALALCATAWAAVTEVGTETELRAAVAAGDTIKLTGDIELEKSVIVDKTVTIDLAGFSITAKNATLSAAEGVQCKDSLIAIKRGGNLTINDSVGGGSIDTGEKEPIYAAVKLTVKNESDGLGESDLPAKLTVNGGTLKGYYYAICGNGQRHNTEITINGGTLTGYAGNDHYAIFHPQQGTLTINGGTLEGTTGIEMRAGTLNVNGGTIKSNGTSYEVAANGDGSTTKGAAIAVAEHNTGKGVTVNIKGGTLIADGAAKALSVTDPQGVSGTDHPVAVKVTGGTVSGEVVQNNEQFGVNRPTTITGGTFSADVTEFVPVDTAVAKDENGNHYVGSDSIAAAANGGKDLTVEQGDVTLTDVPAGVTIKNGSGGNVTVNGVAVTEEMDGYTVPQPHHHTRRQPTTTTTDTTTTDTTTTTTDAVTSAKTFDGGIALYGVMAVLSVTGSAVVIGKKKF